MLAADTLWQLLRQRCSQSGPRPLLIDVAHETVLSTDDVHRQALRLAGWLQGQGVMPGDIVGWQLPTRWKTVVLMLALARLGALQVPVIHLYRERELSAVLQQSRPAFFVTSAAQDAEGTGDPAARVRAAIDPATTSNPVVLPLPSPWPADDAQEGVELPDAPRDGRTVRWHYYTSGTSSSPKAVLHTDASLMAAGTGMARMLGMGEADVGSVAYPFAHVGGVAYLSAALASGMSVVLFDRFVPAEMTMAFRRFGVTFAGGSTAHYQAMLAEQRRHPGVLLAPSLKVLAGGGASKPAALFDAVKAEIGCKVVHAYGLTESPISTFNRPGDTDEQLAHSDGLPVLGMEIRILRPDGTMAAVDESGEILLRGPNVCAGYLDPAQTREAFDAEGFLHTGDLGLLRADGRLAVTGRLKDIIIRKGENISAREVEELLLQHPLVRDVAVIGLPDEDRGERVCAVIEPVDPAAPLTLDQMRAFLKAQQLMPQKIPEQLEVMERLPRSEALQKVAKPLLKQLFMR